MTIEINGSPLNNFNSGELKFLYPSHQKTLKITSGKSVNQEITQEIGELIINTDINSDSDKFLELISNNITPAISCENDLFLKNITISNNDVFKIKKYDNSENKFYELHHIIKINNKKELLTVNLFII